MKNQIRIQQIKDEMEKLEKQEVAINEAYRELLQELAKLEREEENFIRLPKVGV